ncbi:MAG: F0F1 ATP synthase subunit epsilon [Breznakibacter sp.]
MEAKLYLEVVTPEKVVFQGNVISVSVPSEIGKFTILKDHAPIVATLQSGVVKVEGRFSEDYEFPCASGVVQCLHNEVTVLIEK